MALNFRKFMEYVYVIYPSICTVALILPLLGLGDESVCCMIGWIASVAYFVFDLFVQLWDMNWGYIFHHILCLTMVCLRFWWTTDSSYCVFMRIGMAMEVSNVFMNLRTVLAKDSTAAIINDFFFTSSWMASRMGYAFPKLFTILVVDRIDCAGFESLISGAVLLLFVLHLYWGALILRKVYRTIRKLLSLEKKKKNY